MSESFSNRLKKAAIAKYGVERGWQTLLAAELSKRLGEVVKPQSIQYLATKAESSEMTADIASILNVSYEWLARGKGGTQIESPEATYLVQRGDDIQIPQLAVAAAMGKGAYPPDHIDVIRYVGAKVSELRRLCTFSDPTKLQIITGYGSSMEPTFKDGDALLVDTGINLIELDAIFVFSFKGEMFIKSIQRVPGNGYLVISHNRTVAEPWAIKAHDMEQLTIHGRVILAWNARRL